MDHSLIAPYGAHPVQDGGLLMISVQNDREWLRVAGEVLCRPDLAQRENLKRNVDRVNFRAELNDAAAQGRARR